MTILALGSMIAPTRLYPMNQACTHAEIAIREGLADFAAEIHKIQDINELNAMWRNLRDLERATQTLADSASDKADRIQEAR